MSRKGREAGIGQGGACRTEEGGRQPAAQHRGRNSSAAASPRLSGTAHAANHAPRIRRDPSVESRYRVDAVSRQTDADDEKKARLAAALRENLKRRKAQARARRAEVTPAPEPAPEAQADSKRS
jgi:hypothetical protein